MFDRAPEHDRRRAGGLEAEHPRSALHDPRGGIVRESRPVRADVAGVADRDRQDIRCAAQVIADLERRGLLAGQPIRVHGVHDRDRVVVGGGQLANHGQRLVEVSVDGHDPRAGHHGLQELAHRNGTLRKDDDDLEPRRRAVRGCRGGRIAGRGADDRSSATLDRLRHGEDHPAVLERAGRVHPLELHVEIGEAELRPEATDVDERGRPLAERQVRRAIGHREPAAIALDEAGARLAFTRRLAFTLERHRTIG